jgi:hypothetical protein
MIRVYAYVYLTRHAAQSRGEEPSTLTASDVGEVRVRILTRLDFEEALKVTHPSVHKAEEYQAKVKKFARTS